MKRILLLAFLLTFGFGIAKAQTFTIDNTTNRYFIGALHQYTGGCSPVIPVEYFYDIPDNFSYTYNYIVDENGNPFNGKYLGISFQEYPGGNIYTCSFCISGALNLAGTRTVFSAGIPVTVTWNFTSGNLIVVLS